MPVNSFDDYPMSWRPVLQRTGPLSLELAAQLDRTVTSRAVVGVRAQNPRWYNQLAFGLLRLAADERRCQQQKYEK